MQAKRKKAVREGRREEGKPDGDVQARLGLVTLLRVQESLSRLHIKSLRSDERVGREMESRGFLHAISRKYHRNNQVKAAVEVCFNSTRI